MAGMKGEIMHSLCNMALVDHDTNSALGNKLIDEKRNKLKQLHESGKAYIPIGTWHAFNKHFSDDVKDLKFWTKSDRDAYFEAIRKVYEYYLLEGNDLDKVVSFASCDNADICYYATSTDIYAILITSGQAIIRHVAFSPQSSGEKITRIVHYKQGWYGVARNDASYEFQNRTNRLQILVITYNESTGEGKIYLRPFNLSTGLFTVLDNGVLTGFGEISAVCPSLR